MTKGVKIVIAVGAVAVTTQIVGFILGKKLMKASKDVLEAFASTESSPEEESSEASFVDVEEV